MAVLVKTRALGDRRARHDGYSIEVLLRAGLKKQRDVGAKPAIRPCLAGAGDPALADDGVEDVLKFTAFGGIGKDDLAQPAAAGRPGGLEGRVAEGGAHRRPHGVILRE